MAKKFGKVVNANAPKTGEKSASRLQAATTLAHLLHTISNQLGHVKAHHDNMGKKGRNPKEKQLDYEHAATHLDGAIEHTQKEIDHIVANYPREARELAALENRMAMVSNSAHTAVTIKRAATIVRKNR